jgi:hypothetical protein
MRRSPSARLLEVAVSLRLAQALPTVDYVASAVYRPFPGTKRVIPSARSAWSRAGPILVAVAFHVNSPTGTGTFATGSIGPLRGDSGLGFYRLTAPFNLVVEPTGRSGDGADQPMLTELEADARAGGKVAGRFTSSIAYLPVHTYPESSNQVQVPLICDLDRPRLEAIETLRAGGDLHMDFNVQVRFSNGRAASFGDGLDINRGVWIDLLGAMDYQKTLLIEVPLPDPVQQPGMAAVVGLLAQAQGHMMRGYDRDAVGTLRDVLDRLTLALGDSDDIDPEMTRVLFANGRSMTKADRLRVLRRALKLVMHPARHQDGVTVNIDWSRVDAAQMITMTAAFINEMGAPGARPPVVATPQPAAPASPPA